MDLLQIQLEVCLYTSLFQILFLILFLLDGEDIVDEILKYFKANILFRNFEVKGDSDRLLIYGILYVSACLNKMVKKSKQEATSAITTLALEKFALPGDSNFPLGGLVNKPSTSADQGLYILIFFCLPYLILFEDTIRQYLTQLRQEIGQRLIEKVYAKDASQPDKWWICFAKRKFLNLEMS